MTGARGAGEAVCSSSFRISSHPALSFFPFFLFLIHIVSHGGMEGVRGTGARETARCVCCSFSGPCFLLCLLFFPWENTFIYRTRSSRRACLYAFFCASPAKLGRDIAVAVNPSCRRGCRCFFYQAQVEGYPFCFPTVCVQVYK